VAVVDSLGVKDSPIKWDGISLINNLQYAGTTITVWRSYDVGSGKMIDKQLPQATTSFSGTFQQAFSPGDFVNFSKEGRPVRTQESSDRQTVPEVSEILREVQLQHPVTILTYAPCIMRTSSISSVFPCFKVYLRIF